jgi:predicted nucleic acid-binding protein
VLLDTSVLASGIVSPGPSRRLIQDVARGDLRLVTSIALLNELECVLVQEFHVPIEVAKEARDELESLAEIVPADVPAEQLTGGAAVGGRVAAVHAARGGRAAAIVTLDRELLAVRSQDGVRIVEAGVFESELAR